MQNSKRRTLIKVDGGEGIAKAMEDSFLALFFWWNLSPYLLPGSSCMGIVSNAAIQQVRLKRRSMLRVAFQNT